MPAPVDVATSKIQILGAPIMPPGTCMLCGASRNDDRDYIDMGKDIQFVGVIYFCTFCMTELANAIGCLMPEQAKALEDELDAARQRILEFETKDRTLNDAISSLRGTGLFSGTDFSAVNPHAVMASKQDAPEFIVDTEGNEHTTSSSIDDTSESTTEQRSDDVPAARDDEIEFKLTL
jgi:hypothetical protein